jgi:hypothetical protein
VDPEVEIDSNTLSWLIAATTALYVASYLWIAWRLRARHEHLWRATGEPRAENWYISGFRLVWFVLFSPRSYNVGDGTLTLGLWTARALTVLVWGLVIAYVMSSAQ